MLPGKNNLAADSDGLAFTIAGDPLRVVWEREPVKMRADDAAQAEQSNDGGADRQGMTQAADWLAELLADGEQHPVKRIREAAHDAGVSWRSVQRAASRLKVMMHRVGFGAGGVWQLPSASCRDESAIPGLVVGAGNHATGAESGANGTNGTNGTNG